MPESCHCQKLCQSTASGRAAATLSCWRYLSCFNIWIKFKPFKKKKKKSFVIIYILASMKITRQNRLKLNSKCSTSIFLNHDASISVVTWAAEVGMMHHSMTQTLQLTEQQERVRNSASIERKDDKTSLQKRSTPFMVHPARLCPGMPKHCGWFISPKVAKRVRRRRIRPRENISSTL